MIPYNSTGEARGSPKEPESEGARESSQGEFLAPTEKPEGTKWIRSLFCQGEPKGAKRSHRKQNSTISD